MKNIQDYIGPNGMVGHKDEDRGLEYGDSTQRTGTLSIATNDQVLVDKVFGLCWKPHHEPVRYPDDSTYLNHCLWYSKPGCMSRDNFLPLILANPSPKHLWRSLWALVKRGGFLWNTKKIWQDDHDLSWKIPDWCGLAMMSALIRGFNAWWLYPVLCITDITLVFNAILRIMKDWIYFLDKRNEFSLGLDWEEDDLNLSLCFIRAKKKFPTPTAWIGRLIYKNVDTLRAWQWYFKDLTSPPLDVIMEPLIRETFK